MTPTRIKIKNFFSHRYTEVDFTKFDAALLIGNVEGNYNISNGSGKSSIFDSILWCLFNKSRTASIDDIIMWNEDECAVSLTFSHQGNDYRILRTRSRVNGTSTVSFHIMEDGEWKDKSGSTARLTNNEITDTIKVDYKTFINSAYFRQNDISEFAESDAGRKKEILKNIIDLSKWDDYESKAKAALKTYKQECTILSAGINNLDKFKNELEMSRLKLSELQKLVLAKGLERDSLSHSIENLSDKYSSIKQNIDTDQWDKVTEEIAMANSLLKTASKSKESLSSEVNKYKFQIDKAEIKIKSLKAELSKLAINKEASHSLEVKSSERLRFNSEISSNLERLSELDEVSITAGSCYTCGQDVSKSLSDKIHSDHEAKASALKKKIIFGKNKLNELDHEISNLRYIVQNNERHSIITESIKDDSSKLAMLVGHFTRISSEESDVSTRISNIKERISSNELVLKMLRNEDFNKIRLKIKDEKLKRTMVQSKLEELNRELGIYSQKVINLEEKINKMQEMHKVLLEKKGKLLVHDRFARLLGKNGIQTILLNAVIEDLESISNEILTTICNEPFKIILDTKRVGSDGISIVDTLDLKVKKDGIVQNFKSLSGGEQFRISLALRISLSEISSKHGGSSLGFLLLDEINSPLDRHGTETLFVNVIKSLEKRYKILVITHDDLLKEKFDCVLDVTKVNGESSANFITK